MGNAAATANADEARTEPSQNRGALPDATTPANAPRRASRRQRPVKFMGDKRTGQHEMAETGKGSAKPPLADFGGDEPE
jgi:hypothetical protein